MFVGEKEFKVIQSGMTDDMTLFAREIAFQAFDKHHIVDKNDMISYQNAGDIAKFIRHAFNDKYQE
jgi:hypothetical protein